MSIKQRPLLLFDLGNVIMEFVGFNEIQRLWKPNMTEGAIRGKWLSSPAVIAFEKGHITPKDYSERWVDEWDAQISPRDYLDQFISWAKPPFPGSPELLENLSAKFELACLSNTNESHWNKIKSEFGIHHLFDYRFVSHEMGMVKPDAEIFQSVLKSLERPADEVIFFDDAPENVEMANSIGINAHIICGINALSAKCVELNLLAN